MVGRIRTETNERKMELIENLLQSNRHSDHPSPGSRTFECWVQMRVVVMNYQTIQLLAVDGPVTQPRNHPAMETLWMAIRRKLRESSRPSRRKRSSWEWRGMPAMRGAIHLGSGAAVGPVDQQP